MKKSHVHVLLGCIAGSILLSAPGYSQSQTGAFAAGKPAVETQVISESAIEDLTNVRMQQYDAYFAAKQKELDEFKQRTLADAERQINNIDRTYRTLVYGQLVELPNPDFTSQELRIRDAAARRIAEKEDALESERARVHDQQRKAAIAELTAKTPTREQKKEIAAAEYDAAVSDLADKLMKKYDSYFAAKRAALEQYKKTVYDERDRRIARIDRTVEVVMDREPIEMANPDFPVLEAAIRAEADRQIQQKENALQAEEQRVRSEQLEAARQQLKRAAAPAAGAARTVARANVQTQTAQRSR
jgi:exonuclease VII large subunit